ncbi:carboxypeptidase regulatory-like domain-containing protein [Polynucleobacter sp. MWH-UH23A]|uniref:carboxypeptidase regulatory-like domain-containing protein n=1 Tax=Polynucleobacter sp. MWH-UH23A TaxID=1855613 RepID=UPI0033652043
MKLVKFVACILVALCSSTPYAQIPKAQYSDEIPYISGGIGSGESEAIEGQAKQWPLMLQFSQIDAKGWGSWISGVKVRILSNQKNEIFSCTCEGPLLLIDLKSGEYMVEASYSGVSQQKTLLVKKGQPEKVSIYWK